MRIDELFVVGIIAPTVVILLLVAAAIMLPQPETPGDPCELCHSTKHRRSRQAVRLRDRYGYRVLMRCDEPEACARRSSRERWVVRDVPYSQKSIGLET